MAGSLRSHSRSAVAQNANTVVTAASKAIGVDNLDSITYSGSARNGAFARSVKRLDDNKS